MIEANREHLEHLLDVLSNTHKHDAEAVSVARDTARMFISGVVSWVEENPDMAAEPRPDQVLGALRLRIENDGVRLARLRALLARARPLVDPRLSGEIAEELAGAAA